jgi:hypothetical protein
MKFIPADTGIINEKSPEDNALNKMRADKKISRKAAITCRLSTNLIQSLKVFN